MANFILIVFCVAVGMLFQRYNLLPKDSYKGINIWVLYIALPAVSFKYIPKIAWSAEMLFPILSSVIILLGAWCYMELYARKRNYSQRSRSTLELAGGYSNTSFVGFPLVAAYFGAEFLSIAIICDQSMFILLSTAGIVCSVKGNRADKKGLNARIILRRLISFPPLIGCVLALVLSQVIDLSPADTFFDQLVATVAPLALFSIGLQLKFKGWRKQLSQISMTMIYKLILAPALVLVAALVLGISADIARISIFEAAMPTLVTSSIIAEQYNLNTKLVNLTIGLSIIVGLVTTAIWDVLLMNLSFG